MTALNAPANFNWPLAYEAEALLSAHLNAFLERNAFARTLARRMRDETGTEFFEWTDSFVVSRNHEAAFRAVGFLTEKTDAPAHITVLAHPHAMLPRVRVCAKSPESPAPGALLVRPEYLADFMARQGLAGEIEGAPCARYRVVTISRENGTTLRAGERLGYRGYLVSEPAPGFAEAAKMGAGLTIKR